MASLGEFLPSMRLLFQVWTCGSTLLGISGLTLWKSCDVSFIPRVYHLRLSSCMLLLLYYLLLFLPLLSSTYVARITLLKANEI
ncbi:hypothetical protein EV363DRAFT_1318512 [Boletus edulis]|nr:hypothetical protein EV363DRAFT_1318512 [Boletus edulis]